MDLTFMSDFWRVLRLAVRSRRQLALLFFCSISIGVLWVANIGIFLPFLETIFFGETIPQSVSRKIQEGQETIEKWEAELAVLKTQDAEASTLPLLENRIRNHENQLEHLEHFLHLTNGWLPNTPFKTLLLITGLLAFASLLKGIFLAWNDILVAHMTQSAVLQLRTQFFRHVMTLDLKYFSDERTPKITSRFTHDIQRVGDGVQKVLSQSLREPCKMLACLLGAAWISWQLLLLSFIVAPITAAVLIWLSRINKRMTMTSSSAMAELYNRLSNSLSGIRIVKCFAREGFEQRKFNRVSKEIRNRIVRAGIIRAIVKPVVEMFGIGVLSVGILLGGWLVLNQQTSLWGFRLLQSSLSPSALIIFFGMLVGATDPLRKLSGLFVTISRSAAAAERVHQVLNRQPEIISPEPSVDICQLQPQIEFRDVTFSYPGSTRAAVKNFNLKIHQGECVAVLGANGSGKSTLLNLVLRYYDPQSGAVLWDGVDLREINLKSLYQTVGVMQQHAFLFDESIEENIRYGLSWISSSKVESAAKQAGIHDEIEGQFENGYQTVVGEAGNLLSGGQKQKIALARVLLRDPQLFLLDEVSSQLDSHSEYQLVDSLRKIIKGRTTIMITHRPALLTLATRFVLMQDGEIQLTGNHAEMMQKSELYRSMNLQNIDKAA